MSDAASNQSGDEAESNELSVQELLAELAKRGATMEEIAQLREPVARTPAEAIRALKIGNSRFFSGQTQRPEHSPLERRAQIIGQTPFAVVLGCSDSRVPTEYVFDQSAGNIFTIRVAGNVVSPTTVGSIEYAQRHLKPHVVVVMGHEGCGAVHAAMTMNEEQIRAEPEGIQLLLERIGPAVRRIPAIRDNKARMREAVIASVRQQVHYLKQNAVVKEALEKETIAVVGAYYELSSGAVDFFETEEELRLDE
ncbi:MAG: carbonic anhydrase [Pyrinomonadaceae bacterium]